MMKYPMRSMIIACALLMSSVVACERSAPRPDIRDGEEAVSERVEESDKVVRSEEWPEEIERIVSLAPNITEILFELGVGDQVVGVTRYCDWPPEAEAIPKIGGMLDPDYEAILAARPDVVLGVKDGADHQILERLENAGVAYGFLEVDDIVSIQRGILVMGEWLDVEDRAQQMEADFDERLAEESRQFREKFELQGVRALIVFDQEPVVAAGVGSFGHELLILAGLENALGDDLGQYPVLDMETVLSLDPELIIDVSIGPTTEEVLQFWTRFESLKAVQNEGIIHIDDPVMMRPGPRIPDALRSLGAAIEGI